MMEEKHIFVEMKHLPSMSALNSKVQQVVQSSSWFELYGADWVHFLGAALILLPSALYILSFGGAFNYLLGIFMLSCYFSSLTARAAHLASHGATSESSLWNQCWFYIFAEFLSSFSTMCTHDIHIKYHHPYTNIIGLGDSSTWKASFLPCYIYMFLAPLAAPPLFPLVSIRFLITNGYWKHLLIFLVNCLMGVAFHVSLLMYFSGFTLPGALSIYYAFRAFLLVPYIHINIFQHIGLPMYSPNDRPARIYQMASGCFNLSSNILLNFIFGHSLVSCHVEHHLFPKLSDNMCMRIKPIVRQYLKENGLPYHEESYFSRLITFLENYETLMVNAPPITHFVGIQ